MSDNLEPRLRAGLRTDPVAGQASPSRMIERVRLGVRRRRTVRVATAVTAVVALTVVVGALTQVGRSLRAEPAAPSTASPTASPTGPPSTPTPTNEARPDRRLHGTTGLAASTDALFRVTVNVGCDDCSTVWRRETTGDWQRLHDFGAEAYRGRANHDYGPENGVVVDPAGDNLWVTGSTLWSSHDAGATWAEVRSGPSRRTSKIAAGSTHVIAVAYPGFGRWSSPVGSDDWTRLPNDGGTSSVVPLGDAVAFTGSDEGGSSVELSVTYDGVTFSRASLPCGGDAVIRSAGNAVFILCENGRRGTVWRSVAGGDFAPFAEVVGAARYGVYPVSPDAVLLAGGSKDLLVTAQTQEPVEVPGFFELAATGDLIVVNGSRHDAESTDGGRTWSVLP